ncbi:hypothetical protein [Bosea sp. 117]|uniref:hypothetical protein n=1 Tax=Bosea sp. 117 TaxID=1125973 RepID=UPI0012DD8013|nr:hypothetical protein [Bosea sp. 117]
MAHPSSAAVSSARICRVADRAARPAALVLCGVAALFFFLVLLPPARPFPYSDDWVYPRLLAAPAGELFAWFLAPNNDHFIPVMKVVQFGLLQAGGFDFRVLIALNAVLALAGALCFLAAAARYRGGSRVGDLVIPLLLLNPAFAAFGWGFAAQFVFSVAFSAIFLAAFVTSANLHSRRWLVIAFTALGLCALSGMNGLIVAGITALFLLVASFCTANAPLARATRWGSAMVLLLCLVVLWQWRPSGASISPLATSPERIGEWLYGIATSSFAVAAVLSAGWWRAVLVAVLVALAAILAARSSIRHIAARDMRLADAALHGIFFGHLVMLGAIVMGRAAQGGWGGGNEGHYGFLTVPLVISAWIIVSSRLPALPVAALGVGLVIAYGAAFLTGAEWRLGFVRSTAPHHAEIMEAFRSTAPSAEIVDRYPLDLFFIDNPDIRRQLTSDIDALRTTGSPLYTHRTR